MGHATDAITKAVACATYTPGHTSTTEQLEGVRTVVDVLTLDRSLQSSYAEHVLSRKPYQSITILTSHYYELYQAQMSLLVYLVTRRLKAVFFNFHVAAPTTQVLLTLQRSTCTTGNRSSHKYCLATVAAAIVATMICNPILLLLL